MHGTVSCYTNNRCRREECRAAMRDYKRGWRDQNRVKVNQEARDRYARNPEHGREIVQRYHQANREKIRASARAAQKAHPERFRAKNARRRATKAAVLTISFTPAQLQARWDYYGNRCWICRAPATCTDHVKPIAKGGPHMLANLRPACGTCNSSKGAEWPLRSVS